MLAQHIIASLRNSLSENGDASKTRIRFFKCHKRTPQLTAGRQPESFYRRVEDINVKDK